MAEVPIESANANRRLPTAAGERMKPMAPGVVRPMLLEMIVRLRAEQLAE